MQQQAKGIIKKSLNKALLVMESSVGQVEVKDIARGHLSNSTDDQPVQQASVSEQILNPATGLSPAVRSALLVNCSAIVNTTGLQ